MDFNIADLDCPQYVSFNSEAFLKESLEVSTLSVDSLNSSEHSDAAEKLSTISDDLTASQYQKSYISERSDVDCPYNYGPTSSMDKENLGHSSNLTENFPLHRPKMISGNVKPGLSKVTVPKPFHFSTDNRIKSKPTDAPVYEKKDFNSELRKNIVVQPRKNGAIKQQPFNLTEAKKRKREAEYQSLAEQVSAFQKKTPSRYHTTHKEFQPLEHWNPPKLVPKSPKLQTVKRRRVVQAISQEERENQEIEEMKAYEFHAKPVDPKIYKQPAGLTYTMKNTRSNSFRLKTTQKAVKHLRTRTRSNKEKYNFKARPVPKAILNGPTGLKEKPAIHVTEPKPPSFETENRLEIRKIHEQEKKILEELQQKEAKKQKPVPVPSVPSVPYSKQRTEIQPFSFDKADKLRFSRKEKKIQEEIERESEPYVFHAQLMPCPEPSSLPVVPKLPPTDPKPFQFQLESRALKHNMMSNSHEEESESFKAQPATVLHKEPFIPEKPPKQALEIKEFNLYTNKRASERRHLKEIKEEEELEKQQLLLLQKEKEEEQERMELMRLRREIVHKANPIRQYKPVELKPSSVPLTRPHSPEFQTDKRIRSRNESAL